MNLSKSRMHVLALGVLWLATAFSDGADAHAAGMIRTAALTRSAAPGTPSGTVFDGVGFPQLDDLGRVSFEAQLSGVGIDFANDRGYWSEGADFDLQLVARGGDPAPGFLQLPFERFIFPQSSQAITGRSGQTAFMGIVKTPPPTTQPTVPVSRGGVWKKGTDGNLELLARQGEQSPGAEVEQVYGDFGEEPAVNRLGQVAFAGEIFGPGIAQNNNAAIWVADGDQVQMRVRKGDHDPAVPSVAVGAFAEPISFNSQGLLAFSAGSGIWKDDPVDGLKLLARSGDPAVGFPTGATVRALRPPTINSVGDILFRGIVQNAGSEELYAIWVDDAGGGRRLVASENQHAPGTQDEVLFNDVFESSPALDDAGRAVFHASLKGPGIVNGNSEGIWTETLGNGLQLVAQTGQQAPGVPSGILFNRLRFSNQGLHRNVNGAGQIAFEAELTGGGGNHGIWALDRLGELRLIAREGDVLDVDDGPGVDLRTIRTLFFDSGLGTDSGGTSSFNDRGQVAFGAEFVDGTGGIFVSNLVAVPEQSTIMLALVAAGIVLVRRRTVLVAAEMTLPK